MITAPFIERATFLFKKNFSFKYNGQYNITDLYPEELISCICLINVQNKKVIFT